MKIPTIVLFDEGREIWGGSMLAFARENGHDTAREIIAQWRRSYDVHGAREPAFIGAEPEFMAMLSE